MLLPLRQPLMLPYLAPPLLRLVRFWLELGQEPTQPSPLAQMVNSWPLTRELAQVLSGAHCLSPASHALLTQAWERFWQGPAVALTLPFQLALLGNSWFQTHPALLA
jgi:hypothetical protein